MIAAPNASAQIPSKRPKKMMMDTGENNLTLLSFPEDIWQNRQPEIS